MAAAPRLNGAIRALEQGKPAFVTFSAPEIGAAQAINAAPYDGVVFDMEHNPYEIRTLRDCLQYMLNRRQILNAGNIAPAVTPFVRIPANGGEMNQWIAKQVLDVGVYGTYKTNAHLAVDRFCTDPENPGTLSRKNYVRVLTPAWESAVLPSRIRKAWAKTGINVKCDRSAVGKDSLRTERKEGKETVVEPAEKPVFVAPDEYKPIFSLPKLKKSQPGQRGRRSQTRARVITKKAFVAELKEATDKRKGKADKKKSRKGRPRLGMLVRPSAHLSG